MHDEINPGVSRCLGGSQFPGMCVFISRRAGCSALCAPPTRLSTLLPSGTALSGMVLFAGVLLLPPRPREIGWTPNPLLPPLPLIIPVAFPRLVSAPNPTCDCLPIPPLFLERRPVGSCQRCIPPFPLTAHLCGVPNFGPQGRGYSISAIVHPCIYFLFCR